METKELQIKDLIKEWDLQTQGRRVWWITQIAKKIEVLR